MVVSNPFLCQQLPGTCDNGKTVRVHTAQTIRQTVPVRIRGGDGIPYRLTRRGVLSHGACHWRRGAKHRRAVHRCAEASGKDDEIIEPDPSVTVQIVPRIERFIPLP